MLDIKFIRDNLTTVKEALAKKGYALDDNQFLALDEARKTALTQAQTLQAEKKKASKSRHIRVRNVRDAHHQVFECRFGVFRSRFSFADIFIDTTHYLSFGFVRRHTLTNQHADLLGDFFLFGLQRLCLSQR